MEKGTQCIDFFVKCGRKPVDDKHVKSNVDREAQHKVLVLVYLCTASVVEPPWGSVPHSRL